MRIMITGGGTGGHTSPALAVIEELRRRDPQLLLQWIGKRGGMEEDVAKKNGVPFRSLPVEGWTRKKSPRMLWTAAKLAYSMMRAWFYLKVFQPQAVFGVGGYVSLPALWVAQRAGVKTLLHEQNKRLGLANRLCAAKVTRLLLSYPETEGEYLKDRAVLVGNPVRRAFLHPPETNAARADLGLAENVFTVLVVGGSQGAHTLNEATAALLQRFRPEDLQVIWSAGKNGVARAREQAEGAPVQPHIHAFIEDMATTCAAADLVISRSGASMTAELAAMGKPALLVPYPHAADNHQEHNARAFEQAGAALVLLDSECTGESLEPLLRELIASPARLKAMGEAAKSLARPFAAEEIAEIIMQLVYENGPETTTRNGQ